MGRRRPGDPPRFMMICDTFGNFFVLNLAFAICCLPIVTIGASINAMNSMMIKIYQDKEGKILKGFIDEFKKGFWKSTIIWFVYILTALLVYSEYLILQNADQSLRPVLLVMIFIELIFVVTTLPFVYWLNARYENTIKMMFINSFILFFKKLWTWLRIVIIWVCPMAFMFFYYDVFVRFFFLWAVILVSLFSYASCMLMMRIFQKLEENAESKSGDNSNKKENENMPDDDSK